MTDDNRTNEPAQDAAEHAEEALNAAAAEEAAAQAAAQNAEAEELNNLRDIFQQEWDKALAESQNEPAIQALDYAQPEEEPDEDGEPEETAAPAQEEAPAKAKKEKKKHGKAPLIVLIVVLVLLLIPLSAYVYVSIKVPDLGSFLSAYTGASAATEVSEKISGYETALTYCKEGTPLESFKQKITEELVVLKCKADGYAAALGYANENLTEEMRANPQTAEFKEFLAVSDKVNAIADGAYDAVNEAFAPVGKAADVDIDAVAAKLGAPELIKTDVAEALRHIAAGLEAEKAFQSAAEKPAEGFDAAMTELLTAVQSFRSLGADAQNLLENATVSLYNNGFVYETTLLTTNYFTEEMLADVKTEAFTAVLADIDALKKADADVYDVAVALFENNTVSTDDIRAAISVTLPDAQKAALVDVAETVLAGLKAEREKNLVKAQSLLSEALNTLKALEKPTDALAVKLIRMFLTTGDEQNAYSLREGFITDETLAAADEDTKNTVKVIDAIYAAENAVNEVFYPIYSETYYGGGELDKDAANKALDALLTEDADVYLTAYVNYFKYLAEGFTTADEKTMIGYLTEFAKAFTDYPAFYNSLLAECYRMLGDYAETEALADKILEVNVADDYANSVKAMAARIKGSVDEALKLAEQGTALAETKNYCAREAVICSLLQGDAAKAFGYAKELYDASLTLDHCEYILIIAATAENVDENTQKEIDEYKAKVEQVFSENSVEAGEKAQGIIDGTLKLEDVFLKSPYYLR